MSQPRPLKNLTFEALEPLWMRLDISTEKMAKALGVTRQALSSKARHLGLPTRKANSGPQARGDADLFKRLWMAGVFAGDIAKQFGYGKRHYVTVKRKVMGLPARQRVKGGTWPSISISEFYEMELARKMKDEKF